MPGGLTDTLAGPTGLALVGAGMMGNVLLNRLDKMGLGGVGCLAGVPAQSAVPFV